MRLTILTIAVLFIFGFAGLTISTIATQGLTLGGLVALFIFVLMLVGIVGALRNPPRVTPMRQVQRSVSPQGGVPQP